MNQPTSPHYAFAHYFSNDSLFPFLYALSLRMGEGNICLDLNHLPEDTEPDVFSFARADMGILESHHLVGRGVQGSITPFVLHGDKLYIQRYFEYEGAFLQDIKGLLASEDITGRISSLKKMKDFLYGNLFPESSEIDWQLLACISGYIHRFCIITGGPGTGKTTTVSKLLALLLTENPEARILLAAPTGKAASRMKESQSRVHQQFARENIKVDPKVLQTISQLDAVTIHSLLGHIPQRIHFRHNRDNPLAADIVVVDECSMIDITLFKKLMEAIDPGKTKVILLGDKNQLASVEAGSLFGDLCNSLPTTNQFHPELLRFLEEITAWPGFPSPVSADHPLCGHIVELQKSYRFDDHKGIGKLSQAVLREDTAIIGSMYESGEDQIRIQPFEEAMVYRYAQKLMDGYIREADILGALKKINDVKILCATHQGKTGVKEINQMVERYLWQKMSTEPQMFYEHKMMMVTRNQPDLGIYNGDIGIVRTLKDREEKATKYVCFLTSENEYIKVLPGNIEEWLDAYAITIHKSQGSEFGDVLICLPDHQHVKVLTKELVYTAITRAKNHVDILAGKEALVEAARRSVMRISGIRERILEV